jgi:hypothetical protein
MTGGTQGVKSDNNFFADFKSQKTTIFITDSFAFLIGMRIPFEKTENNVRMFLHHYKQI